MSKSQSFSSRKGKASEDSSNSTANGRNPSTPSRERNKGQRGEGGSPKRSPFRSMKRSPKRPERRGKTEDGAADGNSNSKGRRNDDVDNSDRNGGNHEEGRTGKSPNTANNRSPTRKRRQWQPSQSALDNSHRGNTTNSNNRSGSGHPSSATTQSSARRPDAADDADGSTGASKEPADEEAAAAAAARSLSRPANFGVGAVDIAVVGGGQYGGGGGGSGAEEGVGLELPPIEEDQIYRREMAAVRAAGSEVRHTRFFFAELYHVRRELHVQRAAYIFSKG